jgi:hypothetical protein
MQLRKLIERRLRRVTENTDVSSDVHAVVAANVGERNRVTTASSTEASSVGKKQSQPSTDERA